MDETGSYGWRSAPIFASDHRGAPQKSAKRKRFQCVPCSFRVSEGSAEPFRSGSLAASVPAARYDARLLWIGASCGRISRAEAGAALRFLQATPAARRKNRPSARGFTVYHTVSGSPKVPRNRFAPARLLRLCLRHGTMQTTAKCHFPRANAFRELIIFKSIPTVNIHVTQNPRSYSGAGIFSCRFIPLSLCCSQHRHAAPILPQKGFSLYRREDFPWLGRGFCLRLGQGAFPAHRARRFHREQAHRPCFTAGIQPQAGASGSGSGVFTAVLD